MVYNFLFIYVASRILQNIQVVSFLTLFYNFNVIKLGKYKFTNLRKCILNVIHPTQFIVAYSNNYNSRNEAYTLVRFSNVKGLLPLCINKNIISRKLVIKYFNIICSSVIQATSILYKM